MLNLNVFPYFDDFNSDKGYQKILFHPAKPVQARELTQLQSILQDQIKHHGDHVFKNGTVVIPGHVFYDDKIKFLKLETVYNQTNIESYLSQMVGKTIVGDVNGITAVLVHYDVKTSTTPTTVYIKYTSAADAVKEFLSAETLTCPDIAGLTFKVSPTTTYTGNASIVTINDGVYYVNGYFVEVLKQSVTVSKYTNKASAVVGLEYIESIVTENEDETLYDNAFGFSNFGAPGAHRLKIELKLASKAYDYTSADTSEVKFIDLLKLKNGAIEYLKDSTKYAEIEKWLARRTYEESGNYVTKKFEFSAHEYRNNDRGAWATNTPYLIGDVVSNAGKFYMATNQGYSGITAPTQTFGIASDGAIYWNELPNKTKFVNGGRKNIVSTSIDDHLSASDSMMIETTPGKAFVKGFEVEFNSTTASLVPKARQTKQLSQAQLYAPAGAYVVVNGLKGLPNVSSNLTKVNLLNVAGATIGDAWVRSVEYLSGDLATPATVEYRVFLFNVRMNSGTFFVKDVHSISSTVFSADIKPTLTALSGSVTASGTTTVTGVGTYFDFELKVGDRVKVGATWVKVIAIASPVSFTASTNVTTAAGSTIYKGVSSIVRLGSYIRELPTPAVKSLRTSAGDIDMQYVVSKSYTLSTGGAETSKTITLTNGETFLPTEHIVVKDTGTLGTSLPVNATYSLDVPATTLTISGLTISSTYKVLVLVKRTGTFAKEKTKTLATKTITLTDAGTQVFSQRNISLTEADCIRLIKVTESGNPTTKNAYVEAGEIDVTKYFAFDTGQRPEFYDVGRITTTRSNTRPLRITFEYFIHSDGDYFSADSYTSIPQSLIGDTLIGDKTYRLPDCIDFRSRIADSGTTFDVAGGASISDPLLSEMTMSTSYSYYLPRKDALGIDENGSMTYIVDGKFGTGMNLATISVGAFTNNPSKDVSFEDDQIVNYTMADVKKLDTRLSNVEYYVALSQLEKQTLETKIQDEFGLEKEKNGFLIDDFVNHDVSDVENPDYKASIDMTAKECRALSNLDGVQLIEPQGVTESFRVANNYQLTGNLITLPYTEEVMINQVMASNAELVQAYASLDFTGVLKVYPDSDNYVSNLYDTVVTNSVAATQTQTINTTSRVYGGVQYKSRYNIAYRRGRGD